MGEFNDATLRVQIPLMTLLSMAGSLRVQNWPRRDGWHGILSPMSITETLANYGCRKWPDSVLHYSLTFNKEHFENMQSAGIMCLDGNWLWWHWWEKWRKGVFKKKKIPVFIASIHFSVQTIYSEVQNSQTTLKIWIFFLSFKIVNKQVLEF